MPSSNDPQSLLTSGNCLLCYNLTLAQAMEIQLLINKLQGGGTGCTTPSTPSLISVSSQTDSEITFGITAGATTPTVGYIIKWGTVSGGPYATGSKTIALPGPYTVGTADGLVVGTPYYFVAQANSGTGCVSGSSGEVGATLVVSSGLIIQNDSTDFLGSAPGANVNTWFDHSGNGHSWAAGTGNVNITNGVGVKASAPPTVDKVRTANGNPTVRFGGSATASAQWLKMANFMAAAGFTGLEIMCVFKRDADPPASQDNAGHPFQIIHPLVDFPNHCPYIDSNVYEGFGRTTRPSAGNPVTDLAAAFRIYDAGSMADGSSFFIKIDNEAFSTLGGGGYTYSQQGQEKNAGAFGQLYFLGMGIDYNGDISYMFQGNIAAVYAWNRVLTAGERANMRAYFHNTYGTAA